MTKKVISLLTIFAIVAAVFTAPALNRLSTDEASAAGVSGFIAGNIISDTVFTNYNTMSVNDIQKFLNQKVPKCDTKGEKYIDGMTRAKYGSIHYGQSTFVCLRDYTEKGKSSAQIIYDVAQTYRINPQVFLVLLQKEQSLITDDWPIAVQYRSATGYGCPDTAPCDSQYYGLTNQLTWSGKMFRYILDANPNWYTPYTLGNNYIRYSPVASCGGSIVNIQNRSTQALYNYTPYQPNQAALNAGWGQVGCGAYGNRNFYLYFTEWFGSTHYTTKGAIGTRYKALGGESSFGEPTSNESCETINGIKGCLQEFEKGTIYWSSATGAWEIVGKIGARYKEIDTHNSALGYPIAAESCENIKGNRGCVHTFEGGAIYFTAAAGAWEVVAGEINDYWQNKGGEKGSLGYPAGPGSSDQALSQLFQNGFVYITSSAAIEVPDQIFVRWQEIYALGNYLGNPLENQICGLKNNGCSQKFEKGTIYYSPKSGAWDVPSAILIRWQAIGAENSALGYPIAGPICNAGKDSCSQAFEKHSIYYSAATGAWEVVGKIGADYLSIGAENKFGYPTASESCENINNTKKCLQEFEKGTIYFSSQEGIFRTAGKIGERHSIPEVRVKLGYPTANESCLTTGGVRTCSQKFEKGTIYYSAATGAWEVVGKIGARWQVVAKLNLPIDAELCQTLNNTRTCSQKFEKGTIYYSAATGAWEVVGKIGAKYTELGAENSTLGRPLSSESCKTTNSIRTCSQKFEKGTIYFNSQKGTWIG